MKKKSLKEQIEHEKSYIEFLEKQILWKKKQPNYIKGSNDVVELENKLGRSRLVLKLLTNTFP